MNITMTEWKDLEAQVRMELTRRWPWLLRESRYQALLRVETPSLTATAELRWHGESYMEVDIGVASSGCVSGGLSSITEFARQVAEVRDAMSLVYGLVCGVHVYQDGECPCGFCSGSGKSQGQTCNTCKGKGKR